MEEEGGKEENAGENRYRPLLGGGPDWILLLELHGERIGDSRENDDPRGMEKDGYPEDFADPHSWALRHIEWSLKASRPPLKEGKANSRP
jgi:hypothetical protein